jgi:hypothetical protein
MPASTAARTLLVRAREVSAVTRPYSCRWTRRRGWAVLERPRGRSPSQLQPVEVEHAEHFAFRGLDDARDGGHRFYQQLANAQEIGA